jgi:hypothetical protein
VPYRYETAEISEMFNFDDDNEKGKKSSRLDIILGDEKPLD